MVSGFVSRIVLNVSFTLLTAHTQVARDSVMSHLLFLTGQFMVNVFDTLGGDLTPTSKFDFLRISVFLFVYEKGDPTEYHLTGSPHTLFLLQSTFSVCLNVSKTETYQGHFSVWLLYHHLHLLSNLLWFFIFILRTFTLKPPRRPSKSRKFKRCSEPNTSNTDLGRLF